MKIQEEVQQGGEAQRFWPAFCLSSPSLLNQLLRTDIRVERGTEGVSGDLRDLYNQLKNFFVYHTTSHKTGLNSQ
jgi:hypothetical protein